MPPGQLPVRTAPQHRRGGRKARRDIQVHQPAVLLHNRAGILPARARIQSEARAHPPIVGEIGVVRRRPKVLVGIAVRNRNRVRSPQQKIGKIAACSGRAQAARPGSLRRRARESEAAARILLPHLVQFDPPYVAAHGDVVRPLQPHHRIGKRAGLIAQEALLPVAQPRVAAVEGEVGRPPILGILIVAADPRLARHVAAVGPVRRIARRISGVLRAQRAVQRLVEGVPPARIKAHSHGAIAVHELEDVWAVRVGALVPECAVQRILRVECLVDARLHGVRAGRAHQRYLVVEACRRVEIRLRIEGHKLRGLGRDPRRRNRVAGKRRAVGRVGQLHRFAQQVQGLREIADALQRRRHQAGLRAGVAVARPLVGHEKVPAVGAEQVRDGQRTAERPAEAQMVVGLPGGVLARDREAARVQQGVVHYRAQVAAIRRARAFAEVADGPLLHAVAHAAVHQQGIARAGAGFVDARGSRIRRRRVRTRSVQIGALKIRLPIGRRSCRGRRCRLGSLLRRHRWSLRRLRCRSRCRARRRCRGRCRAHRRRRRCSRGHRRRRRRCCLDLIQRQQLQFPLWTRRGWRDRHFILQRGETQHLHLQRPHPVRQVREFIDALRIGDRHQLLVALRSCHRRARHPQAREFHYAVVLRSRQHRVRHNSDHQVNEGIEDMIPCHSALDTTTFRGTHR